MNVVPCRITDARAFVAQHHRHHLAPVGGLWAHAVAVGELVVGVAIVGRPVARHLDDGWTVEVTRVAVLDAYPNACSMLYGAAWRCARAQGYRKAVTYTLNTEKGTSVKAAGWRCIGAAGGGSWSVPSRPRVDKHPTQGKFRWEVGP